MDNTGSRQSPIIINEDSSDVTIDEGVADQLPAIAIPSPEEFRNRLRAFGKVIGGVTKSMLPKTITLKKVRMGQFGYPPLKPPLPLHIPSGAECAVCISDLEHYNATQDKTTYLLHYIHIHKATPKRTKPIGLNCGHCFHFKCIDEWVTKTATCPICRAKININELTILDTIIIL